MSFVEKEGVVEARGRRLKAGRLKNEEEEGTGPGKRDESYVVKGRPKVCDMSWGPASKMDVRAAGGMA
jgi:hypothetical protein